MFTTSLTAAVLSGLLASGSLESPKWQTSYRDAALAAADLRKPIVVFITAGSPGKLVKEGALGKDSTRLLRDGFVPLTVDTSSASGQEVAKSFNLTEGLVISDKTGGVQALRHTGAMTDAELKSYLERFAVSTTVATTEYRGLTPVTSITSPAPVYVQPSIGYQPQYVEYQQPYSQPRPVLNAIQNASGFVQNVGQNAVHNVGGFVQNVGGFVSGST